MNEAQMLEMMEATLANIYICINVETPPEAQKFIDVSLALQTSVFNELLAKYKKLTKKTPNFSYIEEAFKAENNTKSTDLYG